MVCMHLGKTPKTGRSLSFTLVWWNAKRKITRQQGETEGRGMDVGEWLGGVGERYGDSRWSSCTWRTELGDARDVMMKVVSDCR